MPEVLSQEIAFKFPKHVLRRPRRQEHVSEPRLLHAPGRGRVRHGPRAQDGGFADVDRVFGPVIVETVHGRFDRQREGLAQWYPLPPEGLKYSGLTLQNWMASTEIISRQVISKGCRPVAGARPPLRRTIQRFVART